MKRMVNGELIDMTLAEVNAREAEEDADLLDTLDQHLQDCCRNKELGGFTIMGITIPSDEKTERRIIGARVKAESDPNYVIQDWTTDGGLTSTTLTAEMIIAISDAFDTHVQKCFSAKVAVKKNLRFYNTAAQVSAVYDQTYDGL